MEAVREKTQWPRFAQLTNHESEMKVINPAERNAVVGIKPTAGLTSRAGYAIRLVTDRTSILFGLMCWLVSFQRVRIKTL